MPTYKLYYFNSKGRAEIARWLFAEAGVPYEDIRISEEEWPKKKPEFPFLQIPVLEVADDSSGEVVAIAESYTIYRYLAREFGLAGKSNLDIARADMICQKILSLAEDLPYTEEDVEKKKKAYEEAFDGSLGAGFAMIENLVLDSGYFVGNSVTIADIVLSFGCEVIMEIFPSALESTPKLKALYERIRNRPRIKEWIAKRPDTPL